MFVLMWLWFSFWNMAHKLGITLNYMNYLSIIILLRTWGATGRISDVKHLFEKTLRSAASTKLSLIVTDTTKPSHVTVEKSNFRLCAQYVIRSVAFHTSFIIRRQPIHKQPQYSHTSRSLVTLPSHDLSEGGLAETACSFWRIRHAAS